MEFFSTMLANICIKVACIAAVTYAATYFESPKLLFWYILVLFIGYDIKWGKNNDGEDIAENDQRPEANEMVFACPDCFGHGVFYRMTDEGTSRVETCERCHGTGILKRSELGQRGEAEDV